MPTIPWRQKLTPEPDRDYLVLASRLPLRSIAKVPLFMGLTVGVVRQLERADGLVGWSLRAQPLARTFWTLSAWTDDRSLGEFVRQMPHHAVLAKLRPHMGPTRFTTWTVTGSALPIGWDDALVRLTGSSAASAGEETDRSSAGVPEGARIDGPAGPADPRGAQ